MIKCLYLLSVVFQMAAGCALFDTNLTEITQHKGHSVLLPCSCSDLLSKPQKFTWETFRTGHWTEVLNDEHYRGRYQLFNNISPANLSLLISDLREEDEGDYMCSTEKEHRDIKLYIKVRRRETSMQSRKPDKPPPSEHPQSKTTTSLPASSSTTQGCALSVKNNTEITQYKGGSVLLPCSCSDLHYKPQKFTWETFRTGPLTEVLNDEHYRGRYQLFNNTSPANLSIFISDLREEDQGYYRCSTGLQEYKDVRLNVKGCELVKKTGVEKVTGFIGESVVLPCVCADLQNDPKRVTWKFNKNNHFQEIYPEQTGHHSNRVKLVSKNPPGNLSLLISDLTEEDQGFYRCSAQADSRDLSLSVEGRRETSTQLRKTDKTSQSVQPKSKTTTSPPALSSTTQGRQKTSTTSRTTDTTSTSVQSLSKTTTTRRHPLSDITVHFNFK